MDYGICLPNVRDTASAEGLEAAAETAERLGWSTVWTTDHLLIDHAGQEEYGRVYEAVLSLAWLGARHPRVRLGTSVIVVPMRNAVLLAKELATLDALSGGRVTAGVGIGWNRTEFGNVGVAERFRVRGAYLEETIRLWRHLWSGSSEPFLGRFNTIEDFVFGPLPVQGTNLPIVIGGRSEPALRRAGTLADGYQSSAASPATYGERAAVVRAAAEAAGRPLPWLTARAGVNFVNATGDTYALRGTPEQMADDVRAFAAHGVTHLALWFDATGPEELVARVERFAADVAPLAEAMPAS
ncbi:MAG: TIGR03619 family F420-dependent LLM class oxidoreductase [Candidatus Limnocylindrales bacterium]